MKLIKKNYQLTSVWFIPIIIIGTIFCFYVIKYTMYEETDEFLTYEMKRITTQFEKTKKIIPTDRTVSIEKHISPIKPYFRDTLILEQADNEMIPYRELIFSISNDTVHHKIVIRQLLLGEDDLLEGTILIILGLVFLISIAFYFMIIQISAKIWKPFYSTLNLLTKYTINSPVPEFDNSDIDEFQTLNKTIGAMLKKSASDFQRTKEFNENASHELQTHLAIIRSNAELLLNKTENQELSSQIHTIYNQAIKLSQAQKSLLLLSQIGNREFQSIENINFSTIINQTIEQFIEAIELRNISLKITQTDCLQQIDGGLALILCTNLIKNAVKHNNNNGFIRIVINSNILHIENSGNEYNTNPHELLQRFKKGNSGNLGIGLALVKQICELYEYRIEYTISETNIHSTKIFFQSN